MGSSPLTRGKLHQSEAGLGGVRLIPAHAGKTTRRRPAWQKQAAHPRSRGENNDLLLSLHQDPGSSPLTRGKRSGSLLGRTTYRLIPAHAGKTSSTTGSRTVTAAHPRSRGENAARAITQMQAAGSSPLTRGKPGVSRSRLMRVRLIPAHAGKTSRTGDAAKTLGAHPRSRGENNRRDEHGPCHEGSSPLTRGKPTGSQAEALDRRLIPAHAGKTARCRWAHLARPAHPRSRGENAAFMTFSFAVLGSSPLTRGKPAPMSPRAAGQRLIPAHAGKTRAT